MNPKPDMTYIDQFSDTPELQEMVKDEDKRSILKDYLIASIGDPIDNNEFWDYLNKQQVGYHLPWRTLKDDFMIAKHELTLISGYTGEGKSDFVNGILLDCISQGAKGFIASLELTKNELKRRILRQATGLDKPTKEYSDYVWNYYKDKLAYKDTRGISKIEQILEGCEVLHQYYGTDVFVFDNLMMLDSLTDDYNKQFSTAQKISEFCKTYPVSVFLVAHSRKPSNNFTGGKPKTSIVPPSIYDVHGASGVANLVDNHISVAINTLKEAAKAKKDAGYELTEAETKYLLQGDAVIKRDKKREQGRRFKKHLYFDQRFRRLKDSEHEQCSPYVEYSKLVNKGE